MQILWPNTETQNDKLLQQAFVTNRVVCLIFKPLACWLDDFRSPFVSVRGCCFRLVLILVKPFPLFSVYSTGMHCFLNKSLQILANHSYGCDYAYKFKPPRIRASYVEYKIMPQGRRFSRVLFLSLQMNNS